MLSWKLEVDRSDILLSKMVKDSYFDICCTTDVGGNKIKLTADEICILMLPYITKDTLDRCLINNDMISKYLLRLLIKLNPDINFKNHTSNNLENPLHFELIKHKIKTTSNYDFAHMYEYVENICLSASEVKDTNTIKKILKICDRTMYNFLAWCCDKSKSEKTILYLLDNFDLSGIVGQPTVLGKTALIYACENGLTEVALKILELFGPKCNIGQVDYHYKNTVLIHACIKSMTHVALKILEFPKECNIGQVSYKGDTALIGACRNILSDVALKIIELYGSECNVSQTTLIYKFTALMWACKKRLSEVALKMIDKFGLDCNIGCVNKHGNTAFIWACENGLTEVIIKMIDTFGPECKYGHSNKIGFTGLMCACAKKLTDTALLLLDRLGPECNIEQINTGDSIYDPERKGKTACDLARDNNMLDVVEAISKVQKDNHI